MKHHLSIEADQIDIPSEEFAALSSSYIDCVPAFISDSYIGLEITTEGNGQADSDEADAHELVGALVQLLLQRHVTSFAINFAPALQSAARRRY